MENKISDIIRTSLENAKDIIDSNTVIGNAVPTSNGTVIIPVSKVSVGIATGGLDYKGKNAKESDRVNNFGGGGGTGITVNPVAFLVVAPDGDVKLLSVNFPTDPNVSDPVETIVSFIRKSPELIAKIKDIFKSESKKDESDDDLDSILE
ncbi:MAG: sporulation protein YtfJ [Ruminococcaceae bacterium]|nr:sporulation protein YtfJ [Oscillospiraceae bacterium]